MISKKNVSLQSLFYNSKEVSDMFKKDTLPWLHKLTCFSKIGDNLKY